MDFSLMSELFFGLGLAVIVGIIMFAFGYRAGVAYCVRVDEIKGMTKRDG
jgi:hypothetical protein